MGKTKIKKIEIEEVETTTKSEVRDDSEEESRREAATNEISEDARRATEAATRPRAKKEKVSKKAQTKQRSKKYQQALKNIEKNKKLPVAEAVKTVQKGSYSKFEGTIEAHINTNAKNLRGLVNMPFAEGRKLKILAFGQPAGRPSSIEGVVWGNEETIAEIDKQSFKSSQKSSDYKEKVDFDVVVTTPEWMPKLAKIAKILGPKSLMPNPKNGTISENLEKTIKELQTGKTEYKTENSGQVIHLAVGKVSQNPEEIVANLKVIYNTVGRSKIKKIFLSPTMGPSVKVDLLTLS